MLTRQLRNDAFKVYTLIRERNMPSNCTFERLVQRSGIPADRVQQAVALLWAEDFGWIRADIHPGSGEQGYFVAPKCRNKTPPDLDALAQAADEAQDDDDDDEDDADEDDDEWSEIDHDDDESN